MDLYAYSQIEDLAHYLEDNNIGIPRLRGLRLMKDDEIVDEKHISVNIEEAKRDYLVNWLL